MKPYLKYKNSGVEWIGEIPEHWEVTKLKYSDKVIMGQSPNSDDYNDTNEGLPFLQGNADFKTLFPKPKVWCETANKIAEKEDVLLSVRAPIGAVNIADQSYGIGRGLCAIRSKKSLAKLLFYLALSLNDELNSIGTGSTYTAVSIDDIANIFIPNIPPSEQQSIANYLDRKTRQIDTLIEKKQKLVDLLKEQRTAIINQAVTRGLNANVKLKDSGIEWLGEIPEHWDVKKLKYFGEIVNGSTPKSGIREYWDGDIVWLTPDDLGKLNGKRIYDSARKITEQGFNSCGTTITPPNSIVLSTRAPIGHICISNIQSCTNQGCKTIIPDFELCDFNFVYYLLYGQKEELQSLGQGSTFTELSSQKLKDLKIPFSPISEQKHIAKHLDRKSNEVGSLIEKHKKSIELLKEYRTALISEVVTGKIDVRDSEKQEVIHP